MNWAEGECIGDVDGKARRKEATRKSKYNCLANIKMYLREIA
jgi:hypothetical protein